jgi:hypothetical protein
MYLLPECTAAEPEIVFYQTGDKTVQAIPGFEQDTIIIVLGQTTLFSSAHNKVDYAWN